jgi:hypothetical protein
MSFWSAARKKPKPAPPVRIAEAQKPVAIPANLQIVVCEAGYPVTGNFGGHEVTHGVSDAHVLMQDGVAYVTELGRANLLRWLASARLQHEGMIHMTEEAWRAAGGGRQPEMKEVRHG